MALRSTDRILVLRKEDPKANTGLIDPAVFEGKNNLHIVMDTGTLLWSFKYEHGVIPPAFRNKFTSFKQAKEHAEVYFKTKKIKIIDVRD